MIKTNLNENKVLLRNYLDVFINNTLSQGVFYYQITINFLGFEEFDNSEQYIKAWNENISQIFNILKKIDFIVIIYLCNELNKNKKPHIHIVLGLKSILGYNNLIKNNIFNYLLDNFYSDVKVDELNSFLDVKQYFNYMWKDLEQTIIKHSFILYDLKFNDIFSKMNDICDFNDQKIDFCYYLEIKTNNFVITKQTNNFNEYTLINLINFYLFYKNYYWNNNMVYELIKDSVCSYKKIMTIKELVDNIDLIYVELSEQFSIQLKNLDWYSLKLKFLKNIEYYIINPNNIFINQIILSFDFLEFKDGLYLIKYNKFLNKKQIKTYYKQICENKLGTTKYYNLTYKYIKNKKPDFWLTQLKKTLEKTENLENFLIYFISIFYKNNNFLGKKRILYIYGEPNTKKTTLTAQILINFYGIENIGFISKNKNFLFENVVNKEIIIFDEYEHYELPIDVLLKLFEGSEIIIDQKFKKPIILNPINLIILSNNPIKENVKINSTTKKALETRLKYIKFTDIETNLKTLKEVNKELIKEEPFIIIYCNEILHKSLDKKKIKKLTIKNLLEEYNKNENFE